jgi:hypothetical protein
MYEEVVELLAVKIFGPGISSISFLVQYPVVTHVHTKKYIADS